VYDLGEFRQRSLWRIGAVATALALTAAAGVWPGPTGQVAQSSRLPPTSPVEQPVQAPSPSQTGALPGPTQVTPTATASAQSSSSQPPPAPPPGQAPTTENTIQVVGQVSITMDPGNLIAHTHQLPAGVRDGDLILATIEIYDADPFGVPSGFAHVATATGGDGYRPKTVMLRRWATAAQSSVAIPFSTYTSKSSSVAVYRGVDRSAPLVDVSTVFNDGGTAITAASVTAGARSRLVMVVGACSNSSPGVWTGTPAGMTRRAAAESDPWRGMVFYDQTVQAGPTGSRTAVRAEPTHQSAIMVALRVA
jgi:hypothetical protein